MEVIERRTWRVHPERNKDGSPRDGQWRYCADADCPESHNDYFPFHGLRGELEKVCGDC